MSDSEIEKLIKATMQHGKENALRDRCFIKTLAYMGMRRQEALKLDWEDIDFNQNIIKIKFGKGKKERLVPALDSLSSDLWAYLQTRLPLTNQAVFISATGNRLSPTSAQLIFRKYIKKSWIRR